jgi:hypothetical protein
MINLGLAEVSMALRHSRVADATAKPLQGRFGVFCSHKYWLRIGMGEMTGE